MPMEITEEDDFSLIMDFFYHLLYIIDNRVENFGRVLPPPIQISSRKGSPIISIDDSVRVEHWDNFEYEIISENLSFFIIRIGKEFNNSLHHPRSDCFSRVNSCTNDYRFLGLPSRRFCLASNG